MKKRTIVMTILALLFVFSLTVGTAFAQEELVPLKIRNDTDQNVFITLVGEGTIYGLAVGPNSSRDFSVRRGTYEHTTFSCGTSASGTIDMSRQLRLIFTPCAGAPPNGGEPSIEKVHLTDTPEGKLWQYQYK
ncbi:MAG TPA: hypothetical protein VE136_17195 [Anaerolineales bacterium]|jgi:hypothetical protein|nr:hypothetical protein [Anaerolineales bacterium]